MILQLWKKENREKKNEIEEKENRNLVLSCVINIVHTFPLQRWAFVTP